MRLDSIQHAQAARPAARPQAGHGAARGAEPGAAPAPAPAAPEAALSVTATWQWSLSLQVSQAAQSGAGAPISAAPAAEEPAVEEGREARHGRAHVAQALHQLERVFRHELRELVRDNPDLDPAVREELRAIGQAFRDDLRAAFHDAGRGHDFGPAQLLDGVRQALLSLADNLGALIGEEEAPPTEETPPAETPPPADVPDVAPPPDPDAGEDPLPAVA